jgi:hypothetical protein
MVFRARVCGALGGLLLAATAAASVGPERAAQLQGRFTPLGGERGANAEGTIPAWDGGLSPQHRPENWQPGGRYVDPYPGDKPLLTIDKGNAATYAAKLSPGEQALLAQYPDSYRLPVYPTRRSYAAPDAFYTGTYHNALQAFLGDPGDKKDKDKPADPAGQVPLKAVAGIPFPFPDDGNEAMWNQRLRWRGTERQRIYLQMSVTPDGAASLVRLAERARYDSLEGTPRKHLGVVLAYTASAVFEPAKLAGTLKLVWDSLLPPGKVWQRSPGQVFINSTNEASGDTPALGANGLLHEDQSEGYSGSPGRYEWKLRGKRELFVPYNAYRLHDEAVAYSELPGAHNLNPDLARYELHRVWVVEGRCRPNASCAWPHRTLYLDEDSWAVLLAEVYASDDHLAQVQEVHTLMAWDQPVLLPALEAVYDLDSKRYLISGMNNQAPEVSFAPTEPDAFDADEMRSWAKKLGAVAPRD